LIVAMPIKDYTIDELIVTCISRQIEDGELVGQGISTPLVAAGFLLAKLTHAPNIAFASAIGQAICQNWAPIGVATIERLWIQQSLLSIDFVDIACDFLPRFSIKEFFRPGQVDAYGNFNNIHIGGSYEMPRLRLPGSGGIPDVTVTGHRNYLYVPRHGRHTFVKKLDFCSGIGHDDGRMTGRGPHYLISDLGQFDFVPDSGRMRIMSMHPGITLKRIIAKTGFKLIIPDEIPETVPPTPEEISLLRETIDPLGVRSLETLGGSKRRKKLVEILKAESKMNAVS
jgi:acyl CoA:acetate/3-ketoacid CoA transferase beta subunit